ncbi:hypothetical protein ACVWYN_002839 [Pedobacter sp. UYP24]
MLGFANICSIMALKLTITVLAIKEPRPGVVLPLEKVMDDRLNRLAAEMAAALEDRVGNEQEFDDLVVWLSYSSSYAIRWKIVNDVPSRIEEVVNKLCAILGYVVWKGSVLDLKSKR